jgi:hypothetical protein
MNQAAELGPDKYPWWPDWRGECAAIVASGPSIKKLDLSILKDRIHVIAIKTNIDRCPWAEACYGCDAAWWIDRKGLPKYGGLKFFHGIMAKQCADDMHRVEIEMAKDVMLVEQPLKLGNGGNSGFQAINLAVQFGATDIILVGFDLHGHGELHWYGRNKWPNANNPSQSNFNRWRKGFEIAKSSLDKLRVNVVNTSMDSELKCFSKMSLADVMAEWGL